MKQFLLSATLALAFTAACSPTPTPAIDAASQATAADTTPYGANAAASGTFVHDGVTLYYETYGEGGPLLLVHGNGGSIGSMAAQIAYFKPGHRVIAMDSRDHGKSTDSAEPITYEKMADDLAALLDHLKAGPADVIGWSDGGIEALLLGIRHPDKVRKLIAMAANLTPGPEALYAETDALMKGSLAAMPEEVKVTPAGKRVIKTTEMMFTEPNIDFALLAQVTAPTLVLSGDHDLIRLEHTIAIFNSLPNANLAVLPNSTHLVPYDDPELFNGTIDRFLKTPFKAKDRIVDLLASAEKMAAPK